MDIRQRGSPFLFPDYSTASFSAISALWNEASGSRIHLTDAGYAIVAGYVGSALRRLPLRVGS